MNKSRFAHHAGRRSNAPTESNCDFIQLPVGELNLFRCGTLPLGGPWLKRAKLFGDGCDRVFLPGLYRLAAFELIGVGVTDKPAESFQVLLPGMGLIVLLNEGYRQNFAPKVRR